MEIDNKGKVVQEPLTFTHPDFGKLNYADFVTEVGIAALSAHPTAKHMGHSHIFAGFQTYVHPTEGMAAEAQAALAYLKDLFRNDTELMMERWERYFPKTWEKTPTAL